jgi:hypothetical protein
MLGLLKEKLGGWLTTGWSSMRILRFVMGMAGLVFAIRNHDMLLGLAGGLLLLMAVFNFGCCAAGSCSVTTNNSKMKTIGKDKRQNKY